jgi:hypothetical protein
MKKNDQRKWKKLRIRLASTYSVDVIDGLHAAALGFRSTLSGELAKATKQIDIDSSLDSDEKTHLVNGLADELYIAEMTTELAGEMMIIALYKTVEIAIKRMARVSGLFTENQVASFGGCQRSCRLQGS